MSKTVIPQLNRELFDKADNVVPKFAVPAGLTEEVIKKISEKQQEPKWMLEKRLQAFEYLKQTKLPNWGPDLSTLNLDEIIYYSEPNAESATSWEEVPEEIKNTFDRLGIPEAEKTALAGVGAQYDSAVIYHNIKQELKDKGVIFEDMTVALTKYEDLVKKYFMTSCVSIKDHYFVMLHAAVWSGGTFIYVPKGVDVGLPLQAYFRMNALQGGQFEHTLIIADQESKVDYIEGCSAPRFTKNSLHAGCVEIFVKKNAKVRYLSIENWSKNTYNLNTKRALVDSHGQIEWVSGNMGSGVTMLYPCSVLVGDYSSSYNLGIAFAGEDQHQDIGAKSISVGKNTSSVIKSKSISVDNGIATYRGLAKTLAKADNTTISVDCDALLIGDSAVSKAIPYIKDNNNSSFISHEARVGSVDQEKLHYLMSRGLSKQDALRLVVSGYIAPVIKKLPMEYAVELQRLVEIELEDQKNG